MVIGFMAPKYTNKKALELKQDHKLFFDNNWGELGTIEVTPPRPYGAAEAAIIGAAYDTINAARTATQKDMCFLPRALYSRVLEILFSGPRLKSKFSTNNIDTVRMFVVLYFQNQRFNFVCIYCGRCRC
jgi:hypothetical protein